MYPHIKNLALAEGLPCHAISVLVRLFPDKSTTELIKRFKDNTELKVIAESPAAEAIKAIRDYGSVV